ncbi:MAG: CehA/McbA family metallohydrolase, partial [Haliea sp.]|uniref:CehA/McbA family metallohydrolase n=1 Tax=Haliea sp. TaxID=1932666 RepID=UPI0032EB384A
DATPDPEAERPLTHALPVDVALGKTDYLEIVSFANHENTADVWYRFLNLGFPLAAGAGTDAMTNYASLRGPIGLNRIFLQGVEPDQPETLKDAIRHGRGFVTNGPLLGLLVNGQGPGSRLTVTAGESVNVDFALRSTVPVTQLELVYNGDVVAKLEVGDDGLTAERLLEVPVNSSGWMLLRAVNQTAHAAVQDIYTYATTNPVWIDVPGAPMRAPEDAAYFIAWLDRIAEHASAREDYNHDWEREEILDDIRRARLIYEELREQ